MRGGRVRPEAERHAGPEGPGACPRVVRVRMARASGPDTFPLFFELGIRREESGIMLLFSSIGFGRPGLASLMGGADGAGIEKAPALRGVSAGGVISDYKP